MKAEMGYWIGIVRYCICGLQQTAIVLHKSNTILGQQSRQSTLENCLNDLKKESNFLRKQRLRIGNNSSVIGKKNAPKRSFMKHQSPY